MGIVVNSEKSLWVEKQRNVIVSYVLLGDHKFRNVIGPSILEHPTLRLLALKAKEESIASNVSNTSCFVYHPTEWTRWESWSNAEIHRG
jgi:hypothetical protein